jgi:hypothetical protein
MYVSEANRFLLQVDSVILKQTCGQNSLAKKAKTSTYKNKNTKYAKPKNVFNDDSSV